MRRNRTVLTLLVTIGLLAIAGAERAPRPEPRPDVDDAYARLPLSFEPNGDGFLARGPGYGLRVRSEGAHMLLGGGPDEAPSSVRLTFAGGRVGGAGAGLDQLPGRVNHLVGDDPAAWRTDLPTYARVSYADVYPGVDVVYYGNRGSVEYDFVVAPGADASAITLDFEGADGVRRDAGDLVIDVAGGSLVQRAPVAYQRADDRREPVASAYVEKGPGRFGIEVGPYDRTRPLVIDPVLVYSTFLGGSQSDEAYDVEVDGSGSAYVVGYTASADFPTAGSLQAPRPTDAVILKINPAGSALVYSTYLGGSYEDRARRLAVDGSGAAYVVGQTGSPDFPTRNALQPAPGGDWDAFVAKLDPSGSTLVYSTYLGGAGSDSGGGIAVDAAGAAYVAGGTESANFPTAGALQGSRRGARDAFVSKIDPAGSALLYSTYLGGTGAEFGLDVDIDGAGNAVVGGETESTDLPVVNAVQATLKGHRDGYVAKLNAAGSALLYSTYLGGTGYQGSTQEREGVYAVDVDGNGNAYLTGLTTASDFPVKNAAYPYTGNYYDAFVTKLAPSGAIDYSTYLGSPGSESAWDIAVDAAGSAHIVGNTFGPVPLKAPIQPVRDGHDAFVTKLNPSGSTLEFSTHLGGDTEELGWGIAVDGAGTIYAVGGTQPSGFPTETNEFPTKNPIQARRGGGFDMFVSKISMATPVPTITGSTWHMSGSQSAAVAPGGTVSAYAVGAFQNVPYFLVLTRGTNCADVVAYLNASARYANSSGFISRTVGTVPAGTYPGSYQVCFRAADASTATGPISLTVS